jgi:hypothetical protein
MSGGAYQYAHYQITQMQEMLVEHEQERDTTEHRDYAGQTALRRRFCRLLGLVAETCRAIEWNDSGDGDDDEEKLIRRCLKGGR